MVRDGGGVFFDLRARQVEDFEVRFAVEGVQCACFDYGGLKAGKPGFEDGKTAVQRAAFDGYDFGGPFDEGRHAGVAGGGVAQADAHRLVGVAPVGQQVGGRAGDFAFDAGAFAGDDRFFGGRASCFST